MNKTISVYMQDTGSTALIDIPCRLYKGSYKDKQIDVYVPKSMLYETESASIVQTISIGAVLVAGNGAEITTVPYYPDYVQDEIVDSVQYAVYSLPMPNTFTMDVGTQQMVVNIVNIDNTDTAHPLVLEIVTSQSVNYVVNESANISQDEVIEADQVTLINGEIQDIQTTLALKQNIQEPTLQTTSKNIPGSINEINETANSNASTIETQGQAITQLQDDVAELQAKLAGAEMPVGAMSGSTLPTNAQLDAYTLAQTGHAPEPNNVIIFTLIVSGGTDRVYKYIYISPDYGWASYEIPALEHASNGTYGSIQGTYAIDSTNNILVNIANGEIVDIYYKDSDGDYQNMRASINLVKDTQDNIIDGTQVVGKATKAVQDQLGNVINTTYAEAANYYTKTQTDAKYLSKTYTNIYYYAADGLVDDVPNTPASGIQFTETVDTIGETLICDCSRTTTGDYHFTKNSSDNSSIVLATDVNCTLQFRLETYANSTILAADLSDVMTFTANTPQTLDITSIYSDLGTNEIDVPVGSTISKKLYAISTDTDDKTVYLYSNTTYPSTYQLNAQSIVLTLNTINGLKAVNIAQADWTDNGDDTYTTTVLQTTHQQPASTRYFLELQKQYTANSYQYIAFTPIVNDSGDITITTNEAIDCVLLIGSNLATDEKGIFYATNPTVAQEIDYNLYGAMKVTQTTQPVALNLLAPTDVSKFYSFFITNDENSTETINWNGEDIAAGSGLQFKWNGAAWMPGEQPTSTTEIYDVSNEQLLSTTINQFSSSINNNANDITTLQNTKQNTLTFDTAPTDASTNPVTSGGVYTALSGKEDTANRVTSVSSSSTNEKYPTAKAVYTAIANRNTTQTINATYSSSSSVSAVSDNLNFGGVTTETDLTLATQPTLVKGHFYTVTVTAVTQYGSTILASASGIYSYGFSSSTQDQAFIGSYYDRIYATSFCTMAINTSSVSNATLRVACGKNLKTGYADDFIVTIKDYG